MKGLLATGLFLLAYPWAGYCEASRPMWEHAALPDSLRAMVHLNSADLPPFPQEDSTLVDPLQWPDSVVIMNHRYYLEAQANQYDVAEWGDKGVIRPGWALWLAYSRPWKRSKRPFDLIAGPAYSWNENRRLWRRTWYEPDTVTYRAVSYVTRPSGSLLSYSVAEREADPKTDVHLMEFEEYFGRDGELLGFSYKRTGEPSQYWFDGRPASEAEWDEKYRRPARELHEDDATPSAAKGAR